MTTGDCCNLALLPIIHRNIGYTNSGRGVNRGSGIGQLIGDMCGTRVGIDCSKGCIQLGSHVIELTVKLPNNGYMEVNFTAPHSFKLCLQIVLPLAHCIQLCCKSCLLLHGTLDLSPKGIQLLSA